MTLREELVADLKNELSICDPDFNEDILILKVDSAIKKVINARNYPLTYPQGYIDKDLQNYYSNIRDIALYYYNKIGADFEQSYNSNGVSRTFIDEAALFKGIRPISRL